MLLKHGIIYRIDATVYLHQVHKLADVLIPMTNLFFGFCFFLNKLEDSIMD